MTEVVLFALGAFAGGFTARRLYQRGAEYWERRAKELEQRERDLLRTVLDLRRQGYEAPPRDEEWPPFVMDDEYNARVAEEREAASGVHDELVRLVIPD